MLGAGDEITAQQKLAVYAATRLELAPKVFLCSPLVDGNPAYHPFVSWPMTDPAKVPAFVETMSAAGVRTPRELAALERRVLEAKAAVNMGSPASPGPDRRPRGAARGGQSHPRPC